MAEKGLAVLGMQLRIESCMPGSCQVAVVGDGPFARYNRFTSFAVRGGVSSVLDEDPTGRRLVNSEHQQ